jgi:mannose-1-phosphate guanylyltransferase / mannose-6-phosphate isomerase
MKIVPIILSGGSGTRLWPLSREAYPKQFLPIGGERSLLQSTWLRLAGLKNCTAPIVVANEQHRFLVAEQLNQIGVEPASIVLEPCARNTAPAIAAAALESYKLFGDCLLLVLPSDHVIKDPESFCKSIENVRHLAEESALLTFGILPSSANTGYGYIQMAPEQVYGTHSVLRFVEKPDLATATDYLNRGDYVWNSGMFLFTAQAFIEELKQHSPQVLTAIQKSFDNARRDTDFVRLNGEEFSASPSISVDYAVMEKSSKIKVQPIDVGWSDVGSWPALWEISDKEENGNVVYGDVVAMHTSNSLIWAESRMVGVIGLDNVVVIDSDDAVLVAHADKAQQVKDLVAGIKTDGRVQAATHRKVYRPWGYFDSIDSGSRFQVKRIVVKPGAQLSLQMHHHRAEHWVVVSGLARVTCDDRVFDLQENQSTYIPLGSKHRLENPGVIPLEIIEVQSGSYLGEDDIVRFEDKYGRDN